MSALCGSRCGINSLVPSQTSGGSALRECRERCRTKREGWARWWPARATTQNPNDHENEDPWEWQERSGHGIGPWGHLNIKSQGLSGLCPRSKEKRKA